MIYVGIDVASEKHDCCLMDFKGKVLNAFSFTNDRQGFDRFLNSLPAPNETKIGLEATGVYGFNLTEFLWCNGYEVTTFNPLAVKKRLSATTLRKTKTDKSDAKFLASMLTQADFQPDSPVSYHISELKSLSRQRKQIVDDSAKTKIRIHGLLTILFPEFKSAFSDPFGASALAVLRKYPSAKDLAMANKSVLTKLLWNSSRHKFGAAKAAELIALAKSSVGVYSEANVIAVNYHLARLELNRSHIQLYDKKIKGIMDEIDSPILTIPGISYTLGAIILSEIGDIRRFSSPAKLTAFAGIEPSVYQSGKFHADSGSMVKRGSPILRWALIQAARCVAQYDDTFRIYLRKKRDEGKHFSVAVSHTAKKLIRVIFSILHSNSTFVPFYSL